MADPKTQTVPHDVGQVAVELMPPPGVERAVEHIVTAYRRRHVCSSGLAPEYQGVKWVWLRSAKVWGWACLWSTEDFVHVRFCPHCGERLVCDLCEDGRG